MFELSQEDIATNAGFKHAWDVMLHTNETILITGKAGTGKSTLLRHFVRTSGKECVVLAPTGIAAINAGGQTVHSFFGLPIRPLVPGDAEIRKYGKHHPKSKIIRKMDVLIIDEVSMLRADIIDAIDHSLRINTGVHLPFGGKQVIFFGDLFQLEPVTRDTDVERHLFQDVYASHFFFDSLVFKQIPLPNIELNLVYRQQDDEFIQLLNNVRTAELEEEELAKLNARYMPGYQPAPDELAITLSTRNHSASMINQMMLGKLDGTLHHYKGVIDGDFNERNLPTDQLLALKVGAQVVFIKNHSDRKYVNGTLGRVTKLGPEEIEIETERKETVLLTKEVWENKLYKFDNKNRRISSEIKGTFSQYPIKLAWAITIHKSQGLTFEKAILELGGGTFAHGQLYVALSRCRTLAGIYLKQQVRYRDLIVNDRVVDFARKNLLTD